MSIQANRRVPQSEPDYAMGLASLVLGSVGLVLFFLPVLSMPLASVGLALGLMAALLALFGRRQSLRWAVWGVVVSGIAFCISVAIVQAPGGFRPHQATPNAWQPTSEPRYISPPASNAG